MQPFDRLRALMCFPLPNTANTTAALSVIHIPLLLSHAAHFGHSAINIKDILIIRPQRNVLTMCIFF